MGATREGLNGGVRSFLTRADCFRSGGASISMLTGMVLNAGGNIGPDSVRIVVDAIASSSIRMRGSPDLRGIFVEVRREIVVNLGKINLDVRERGYWEDVLVVGGR